jgi:uncharacterized protein YbjT (DUF2867 family)
VVAAQFNYLSHYKGNAMIVITTPTGQIGSRLVQDLLLTGEALRLIVRDASRLPDEVRDRADVVEGSHGDAAVVDRALEGADALFWVVPPNPKAASLEAAYLDFSKPACEAVKRCGVGHVVDVSALGAHSRWRDRAGLMTVAYRMDDMFAAAAPAHRVLAMPSFMDNILMQLQPLREQGMFFGPLPGDLKSPTCATRDIAAAGAQLLTDRSWNGHGATAVLGPEDLSPSDMAATMSDVLGKKIGYQQVPFDAFEAQLRGQGMSDAFVRGFSEMMQAKAEGIDNVRSRTSGGTTPTTFRQWCEQELKPALDA